MNFSKGGFYSGFFLLMMWSHLLMAQVSPTSEWDLKKKAEKLYADENYAAAMPMYSQLLALYPKDAGYNYRYGICQLSAGKDKSIAISYLETASKEMKDNADADYFLARSYMYGERYNDAIEYFNRCKKLVSPSKAEKMHLDLFISNCMNAAELMKSRVNVAILEQKEVVKSGFQDNIDFSDASGKLLTTPDKFLTSTDRSKQKNPVMFMTNDGQTIFYASYGKGSVNGSKDIYRATKSASGEWGNPMNLGSVVNSGQDEDNPYLDKDGRTLYFASQGHNSIGGYDIFKSEFNFGDGTWSTPVNLGIPVNTTDDDIFYLPDTKGTNATYASAIQAEQGKVQIRKINWTDSKGEIADIHGLYFSKDQRMRRDARISVVRTTDNGVLASTRTNPTTGEYELVFPPGSDYMLVVEGGGYVPHSANFTLPTSLIKGNLKQQVAMNRFGEVEEMTLTNFFNGMPKGGNITAAENTKPTDEQTSRYDLENKGNTVMQPVNIDGQVVYVVPPSASKATSDESVAMNSKPSEQNKNASGNVNSPSENEISEVKSNPNETPANAIPDEVKNEIPVSENENKTSAEPESQQTVTSKTSNEELVKMSFETAKTQQSEADAAKATATETKNEAVRLDSVSKSLLAESQQAEKSGDKEKARALYLQSNENAQQSEDKMREAMVLQESAADKQDEADKSLVEAQALSKQASGKEPLAKNNSQEKPNSNEAQVNHDAVQKESAETKTQTNETQGVNSQNNNSAKSQQQQTTEPQPAPTSNAGNIDEILNNDSPVETSPGKVTQQDAVGNSAEAILKRNEAKAKRKEAAQLDSLSKAQAEQSNKILSQGGDSKQVHDLFVQSQNNAQLAEAKQREAIALETGVSDTQNNSSQAIVPSNSQKPDSKTNEPEMVAPEFSGNEIDDPINLVQNTPEVNSPSEAKNTNAETPVTNPVSENRTKGNAEEVKTPANASSETASDEMVDPAKDYAQPAIAKDGQTPVSNEGGGNKDASDAGGNNIDDPINLVQNSPEVNNPSDAKNTNAETPVTNPAVSENRNQGNADEVKTPAKDSSQPAVSKESENQTPVSVVSGGNKESSANSNQAPANDSASTGRNTGTTANQNNSEVQKNAVAAEPDVTPEAAVLYDRYQESMVAAKNAEAKSADLKSKADATTTPEEREKLLSLSAASHNESVRLNEDAQNNLSTAKLMDENVEQKMASRSTTKQEVAENKNENKISGQPVTDSNAPLNNTETPVAPPPPKKKYSTTSPEYQEYLGVKWKIQNLKFDKIAAISEGSVLTEKAAELRNQEYGLRTEAAMITDENAKAEKLTEADKLKPSQDSVVELSKLKLTKIRQLTGEMAALERKQTEMESELSIVNQSTTATQISEENKYALTSTEKKLELVIEGKDPNATTEEAVTEAPDNGGSNELDSLLFASAEPKTLSESDKASQLAEKLLSSNPEPETTNGKRKKKKTPVISGGEVTLIETVSGDPIIPANGPLYPAATIDLSGNKQNSNTNPIPMDEPMPEGLIFRVQIFASRNPVPNDAIKNLQPVYAEHSRPGWVRYCVGNFRAFEPANLIKKHARSVGYSDAFVVAYFNGKRIPLYDAYALIKKSSAGEKQLYAKASTKEFKVLSENKIAAASFSNAPDADTKSFYGTTDITKSEQALVAELSSGNSDTVTELNSASSSNGLVEFAVQVGAYKVSTPPSTLNNFLPLNTERTTSGLYRFVTGRYSSYAAADSMKQVARSGGVPDAFIVVYRDGVKVNLSEVSALIRSGKASPTEAILSPDASSIDPSEIIFKVQLGAFRQNVPLAMVSSFLQLSDRGISQSTEANGLHYFYAGNYKSFEDAQSSKADVVTQGVKGAFVVAFRGTQKISIADALKALGK